MKKQTIRNIVATVAVCSVGFLSASAFAGQDESQRQMVQQLTKAKQKLTEAEAAKGPDRQKLMGEHMKMMNEAMEKMQAMKPKAGMSMKDHEAWMAEHQKLMDDMMGQMMKEHHMMMDMGCMSMMGSGSRSRSSDKHEHNH